MKIVFTGGGTGGHFYPIIAVAEAVSSIAANDNLLEPRLFYLADTPYDARVLYENGIEFRQVGAGKSRTYFSVANFFDSFRMAFGIMGALPKLFFIYPDVVFSTGGYVSVPTVFAARLLRIPVMIHEANAIPGRANIWAARFAKRVAISFPSSEEHFKGAEVAYTGMPIRREVMNAARHGAHEFLSLSPDVPTILILGGSQGAQPINNVVLDALPSLVSQCQIIHQTGQKNIDEISKTASVILADSPHVNRYKPFGYLNSLAMKMAAGAADVIISRAGAGTIFEIAEWEKPSIIIPIPKGVSRDQRANAFAYSRVSGAVVIEQDNLTPHLLESEIRRIIGDKTLVQSLIEGARKFKRPDAAEVIAKELVSLVVEHER